jgi:hypothetical protein
MRPERLEEWLRLEAIADPPGAAEGAEDGAEREAAEAALARLLALLPVLAPSPALAARIDARLLEVSQRSPYARWLGSWGVRAATAWVAAQAAILIAIGTAVIGGLAASLGPVRLASGLVSGAAVALRGLLDALAVGLRVAEISQSSLVSTGPALGISLLVCVVASAVGVALLSPLYASQPRDARGALR